MPNEFYRFYHRSVKFACPDLNGLCPRPSICNKQVCDRHDLANNSGLPYVIVTSKVYRIVDTGQSSATTSKIEACSV